MIKRGIKENDFLEVTTDTGIILGKVMPSSSNYLVLKLSDGYNISLNRKDIKKIKLINKREIKKLEKKSSKYIHNKDLPNIVILHTGGTIASKVDYETGGVEAKFNVEDIIEMFPELIKIANIKSKMIGNFLSENLRFKHYNIIAKEIEKEIKKGVDGIIITHGTDTLHYTSVALSFILENLGKPVLLVGAQRSSDRGSSDAALNLNCAFNFIAKSDFAGVGICMHESMSDETCLILPACKTRKMHTSRRDAFKAINVKPIARVNKNGHIEVLIGDYKRKNDDKIRLKLFKESVKVGILKIYPNMLAKQIENFKGYDGLVIEGTGLGHLPIEKIDKYSLENEKIFKSVKKLSKKTVLVMSSQCIFGRVNMNVYSPGRKLQEFVWGNLLDMTSETAFIKLAWLLSNYPKKRIPDLINENLRGEISERIVDDFLE